MNWASRERPALAVTLGGTSVLIAASVLAMVLAFAEKVPCRSGAWNYDTQQYQDVCYTDIYPLYYTEGLSAGKVPYTGHPVEYPVLIGGAMQAAAWLVSERRRGDQGPGVLRRHRGPARGVRGGRRARDRPRGRPGGRWQGLMVALSPALILSAFVNWDLIAMALTALGMAAWAARRGVWAGVLLGLGVATKFYPLVVLGALLLLCLRAGRLREFAKTFAAAALAWLAVNLPVMIAAPSGWATFYVFSKDRGADWGSIWYLFEYFNVPQARELPAQRAQRDVRRGPDRRLRRDRAARPGRAPPAPAAAAVLPDAGRVPDHEQGLVTAVRHLAGAAGGAGPAPAGGRTSCGSSPRSATSSASGATSSVVSRRPGDRRIRLPGHQRPAGISPLLLARFLTVALLAAYVVRDILHPERDVVRARGLDDPAGGVLDQAPDRLRLRLGAALRRAGAPAAS